MVCLVKYADSDAGRLFITAVDETCRDGPGPKRVAFDCEGVKLSRVGSVEIISICFSSGEEVFLVDAGKEADANIISAVKKLLEDSNVMKIIHDCRMDSDALYHLHAIKLSNVHDTSCFHAEITGRDNENLNAVLLENGIEINVARDCSIYKNNPAFWATRPMTQRMIEWASSDVDRLFHVASTQLNTINDTRKKRAVMKSTKNVAFARDRRVETGLTVRRPGLFIGRRGCNLRSLSRNTGTLIYQKSSNNDGTWIVYYGNTDDLNAVKRVMRNC